MSPDDKTEQGSQDESDAPTGDDDNLKADAPAGDARLAPSPDAGEPTEGIAL